MEKCYEVKVDELKFGGLSRTFEKYPDAFRYYSSVGIKLNNVPCKLTMKKVEKNTETGEITENIQYLNNPGKHIALETKLLELKKVITEIEEIEKSLHQIENEKNDLFFDIRHALEMGLGTDLSPEESKNVLDHIHLKGIIRRGAKEELKKHGYCRNSLSQVKINIDKAIHDCSKLEKDQTRLRHFDAKIQADKRYKETLQALTVKL